MPIQFNGFNNTNAFLDYQRAEEEFQQRKQLAQAQLMQTEASLAKAAEVDIGKLGEQAFIKASQGMLISPEETAALRLMDAKQQNNVFNPVTGAMEVKPSLLDRAGLSNIGSAGNNPQPIPAPISAPKPTPEKPSAPQFRYSDFNEQNPPPITINEPPASQPVNLTGATDEPNPTQATANAAMEAEIKAAAGNPKLQQSIREKYAGSKTPDKIFAAENTLRDEFNNVTKDFRAVQDAYSKIGKTSNTGAGDMSMLYQYVKLLDPGSVVRESEFATAAASGSYGERIAGAVKGIISGGRLAEPLRQEFLNEAKNIYSGQLDGYNKSKKTYEGIAQRNGLSTSNVITDYAQPAEQPKAAPRMGEVRKGVDGDYLFNGGNPADKNNWKKVR